jgi:hypothetical protein
MNIIKLNEYRKDWKGNFINAPYYINTAEIVSFCNSTYTEKNKDVEYILTIYFTNGKSQDFTETIEELLEILKSK